MNALVVPFFLVHEITGGIWLWDSEQPLLLMALHTIAICFMLSVCVSRMYLGVHSPADVQGGMMLGAVLLKVWTWFGASMWVALMQSPHTWWTVVCMWRQLRAAT